MTGDAAALAIAVSICDSQDLTIGDLLGGGAFKTVFAVMRGSDAYALKLVKAPGASPRSGLSS